MVDYNEISLVLCSEEKTYVSFSAKHTTLVKKIWKKMKELNYQEGREDALVSLIDKSIKEYSLEMFIGNDYSGHKNIFFPITEKKKDEKTFEKKWEECKKNNEHFWKHTILVDDTKNDKVLYFPVAKTIVLLCDWVAHSLQKEIDFKDWYSSHKSELRLHSATDDLITLFLDDFEEVYKLLSEQEI
jgi:hypothetical protein